MKDSEILARARGFLDIELRALSEQKRHLDSSFLAAVKLVNACRGRTVVMGVGKSGLIGKKITATFSSLGIPAMSVHPADLAHGDFGMLVAGDIALILTYSGESDDLKKVVPVIRQRGLKTILMTGRRHSSIASQCDIVLNASVTREACPYNLAPTASTTAALALGDTIALCVASMRGFRREDFAKYHPGGNLGKKLTLKVSELMHSGKDNPVVRDNVLVRDALLEMTARKLGATSVVDSRGALCGYFTDGDLRRKLQSDAGLLGRKIREVMTKKPSTTSPDTLAADAAEVMKLRNCDNLPVVDKKGKPVGMIDERDLITAGLI